MKLRPLALYSLALLLCSCAATSVKTTSKSPDSRGPVGKIAVLAIDHRREVRQGFENRFVSQLASGGAAAVKTFDQLSLAQIKADKVAAAERFRTSGAEALLIVRLADRSSTYREIRPGHERYAPVTTGYGSGYDYMGWYDYYSVGFMDMSPTYGSLKEKVFLETSLYDLNTEKRLWSAVTQTVVTEEMDRVAEMDPLVEKIVAAMRKDGVIR